jgi:hypothetical protein
MMIGQHGKVGEIKTGDESKMEGHQNLAAALLPRLAAGSEFSQDQHHVQRSTSAFAAGEGDGS